MQWAARGLLRTEPTMPWAPRRPKNSLTFLPLEGPHTVMVCRELNPDLDPNPQSSPLSLKYATAVGKSNRKMMNNVPEMLLCFRQHIMNIFQNVLIFGYMKILKILPYIFPLTLTVAARNATSVAGVSIELLRLSRLLSSLILANPRRANAWKILTKLYTKHITSVILWNSV